MVRTCYGMFLYQNQSLSWLFGGIGTTGLAVLQPLSMPMIVAHPNINGLDSGLT